MTVIAQGCESCEPLTVSPSETRLGESHFAVHLGDHAMCVYLDGEQIWDCFEVIAGPGGRAWRDVVPVQFCPCGSGSLLVTVDESDGYSVRGMARV